MLFLFSIANIKINHIFLSILADKMDYIMLS